MQKIVSTLNSIISLEQNNTTIVNVITFTINEEEDIKSLDANDDLNDLSIPSNSSYNKIVSSSSSQHESYLLSPSFKDSSSQHESCLLNSSFKDSNLSKDSFESTINNICRGIIDELIKYAIKK